MLADGDAPRQRSTASVRAVAMQCEELGMLMAAGAWKPTPISRTCPICPTWRCRARCSAAIALPPTLDKLVLHH